MDIINKVAKSGLVTIDLEVLADPTPIDVFDIRDYLHMEYVLREEDFRAALDAYDWQVHSGRYLTVTCSNDAIVASWAFMLVAAKAAGIAKDVFSGTREEAFLQVFERSLDALDWTTYAGKRVLLKGCSRQDLPQGAYVRATARLMPVAERILYGEACSFVPVWRANKG